MNSIRTGRFLGPSRGMDRPPAHNGFGGRGEGVSDAAASPCRRSPNRARRAASFISSSTRMLTLPGDRSQRRNGILREPEELAEFVGPDRTRSLRKANLAILALELHEKLTIQPGPRGEVNGSIGQAVGADAAVDDRLGDRLTLAGPISTFCGFDLGDERTDRCSGPGRACVVPLARPRAATRSIWSPIPRTAAA